MRIKFLRMIHINKCVVKWGITDYDRKFQILSENAYNIFVIDVIVENSN